MSRLDCGVEELYLYLLDKGHHGLVEERHMHITSRGHMEGWFKAPNRTVQDLILPRFSLAAVKYALNLVVGTHGTLSKSTEVPDGPPLLQALKKIPVGKWVGVTWAMWPAGSELQELRIIVDESWLAEI